MEGGVIAGVTDPADSSWETLLAGGKNVVNMGGNVETSTLGAGPELITINGIVCTIQQVCFATCTSAAMVQCSSKRTLM